MIQSPCAATHLSCGNGRIAGMGNDVTGECTCFWTDPSRWTRYGDAVEPGSQMEPNPDCPVHFPTEPKTALPSPDLAAIEARAAAATEGPWEVTLEAGVIWCVTDGDENIAVTPWPSPDSKANAIFMVAARTDVPALIARIRELEAENAKIDDLDEALRQRDREILGLRRDRDARDARIGELEAAHDLMASQFKIMQAEKEHGWREAARMEAKLERLSS